MEKDEELLLALLNSTPVIDGRPIDGLDGASGQEFSRRWGGTGTDHELWRLRRARDALQAIVRRNAPDAVEALGSVVAGAVRTPQMTPDGVDWELEAPDDDRLAVDAVLAWSNVNARQPGRLRACANEACNLFLVDHSRPGTAKWCSMAVCGNRMKVRAHANRARSAPNRVSGESVSPVSLPGRTCEHAGGDRARGPVPFEGGSTCKQLIG